MLNYVNEMDDDHDDGKRACCCIQRRSIQKPSQHKHSQKKGAILDRLRGKMHFDDHLFQIFPHRGSLRNIVIHYGCSLSKHIKPSTVQRWANKSVFKYCFWTRPSKQCKFFIHVPIFDMKVLAIKQKNNREGKRGKYLVSRGEKDRRRKGGRDFGEEKFLISWREEE